MTVVPIPEDTYDGFINERGDLDSNSRKLRSMKRTPNEIGKALEKRAQKALAGQEVKQSGGGKFWKLDVRDKLRFIWSCKATDKPYLKVTKDLLLEAREAARGMRGTGDDYKPGMITEVEGIAVVVIELDDFAAMFTGTIDPSQLIPPSKAAERRAAARRGVQL